MVPCWTEGVRTDEGRRKAKLTCPSELAYGERGVPGRIPPGAPLVFEVELLEIVPEEPPAAPPAPHPAQAGREACGRGEGRRSGCSKPAPPNPKAAAPKADKPKAE